MDPDVKTTVGVAHDDLLTSPSSKQPVLRIVREENPSAPHPYESVHSSAPFPTREEALLDCEKTSILTAAELDRHLIASAIREPEPKPIVHAAFDHQEATSILSGQQIMDWVQSGVREQGRVALGTTPPESVPASMISAPLLPGSPEMTQRMPQMPQMPQMTEASPVAAIPQSTIMQPPPAAIPQSMVMQPAAAAIPQSPMQPPAGPPMMMAPTPMAAPMMPTPMAAPMPAPLAAPMMPTPMAAPMMPAPMITQQPMAPAQAETDSTMLGHGAPPMAMTQQMDMRELAAPAEPEPNPDLDLFALPQAITDEQNKKKSTSLSSLILMGFFALIGGVIALAIALPTQRALLQEKLFPTAKAPALISVEVAPETAKDTSSGATTLDEKKLAEAARALTEGRRLDALEIYQELNTTFPNTPLYMRLAHSLQVSEASK